MRVLKFSFMIVSGVVLFSGPSMAEPSLESAPDVKSAPWATFRGSPGLTGYRNGHVKDRPELLWIYDTESAVQSTAAIAGGRAFVGTAEKGMLALALDPGTKDGELLWSFPVEFGVQSSAAVRDGIVYFGDDVGVFYALAADSGKELWKYKTEGEAEIISSPSFFGELVLFGSYDATLYCLSTEKRSLRWKLTTEGPVHATPAVVDRRTFVAGCDELLRVIDISTGKEVGAMPLGSYSASSPAVLGDRLFVGTFGEQVLGVRWKDVKPLSRAGAEEAVPAKALRERKSTSTSGDAAATTPAEGRRASSAPAEKPPVMWTYKPPAGGFPFFSCCALGLLPGAAKGEEGEKAEDSGSAVLAVVIGGRDKRIHAIDGTTGKPLWTFRTKGRVDSSPVIIGQRVICGSFDGNIYMLNLKDGEEIWRFPAGGRISASPAVGEGKLVIGTEDGQVFCFGL